MLPTYLQQSQLLVHAKGYSVTMLDRQRPDEAAQLLFERVVGQEADHDGGVVRWQPHVPRLHHNSEHIMHTSLLQLLQSVCHAIEMVYFHIRGEV